MLYNREMAQSQLTAGTGTGTQTSTQSPQGATGQTGAPAAQTGSVQPGTATSVLTSSGGITLQNTPLTTVNLGASTQAATAAAAPVAAPKHHFNPVLFGVSVLLCLIAVALFWATMRSAKNTTDYS